MAFLSKVTSGAKTLDLRHGGKGLMSTGLEIGEYLGTSYLAGRLNAQYPDKLEWRGEKMTYVGGLVGLGLAVAADVLGIGGGLVPHVATISTALVGTHLASIGAAHGLAARTSAPSKPMTALPGGKTMAGAIPPAAPGKYLDLDKISRVAAMHG